MDKLFTTFVSFENLLSAYQKAAKGSGDSPEAMAFFFHLETELLQLQRELISASYQPGVFRYFQVNDPKARTIAVAPFRDRVVHHAVVNLLEPIYERSFIYHSYATRKGKGTHAAVFQTQQYMRRWQWYFKADIEKFFDSIDHAILLTLIKKKIHDPRLLETIAKIIRNGGQHGKGLPIGNLTSQFFANVYLDPLDHFLKDQLGIKGYVRYMDDFVLFAHCKSDLKSLRLLIIAFLSEKLQLSLKAKASFLNQRKHGLTFLGTRIFPGTIRIARQSLRHLLQKHHLRQHQYKNDQLSEIQWQEAATSAFAHLQAYQSLQLRRQML